MQLLCMETEYRFLFRFREGNYIPYVNTHIIYIYMYMHVCIFCVQSGIISRFQIRYALLARKPLDSYFFFKINFSPSPLAAKLGPASDSSVYKLPKVASLFLLTSPITACALLYHTKYTRWLCKKSRISSRFQLPMIYKV
jgi:hypothetical protein